MDDPGKIIEKIQQLKGVQRTQTLIAIPPTSENRHQEITQAESLPLLLYDHNDRDLQQPLDLHCCKRVAEAIAPTP